MVKNQTTADIQRQFAIEAPKGKVLWLNVGTSSKEPRLLDATRTEAKYSSSADAAGIRVIASQTGDAVQVFGLKDAPAGAVWQFEKSGDKWTVLLKVSDGAKALSGTFALNSWALSKPIPAFLHELK